MPTFLQDHDTLEHAACDAVRPSSIGFNPRARIPHGVTIEHVEQAMNGFVDFLGFVNQQLHTRQIERLETMLMPANFSSIVGEFMTSAIPKHCPSVVKNAYHNGHPDLVPAGLYPGNKMPHGGDGIEIKASRYLKSWQGHNAEDAWLMVFCFASGRPTDAVKNIPPSPFRFLLVAGARIEKADWKFAGRSETSRRTITAAVTKSGYDKMLENWIYKDASLSNQEIESLLDPKG